jgi:hypothetical protein
MTPQPEDYKKIIRARLDTLLSAQENASGTPSLP